MRKLFAGAMFAGLLAFAPLAYADGEDRTLTIVNDYSASITEVYATHVQGGDQFEVDGSRTIRPGDSAVVDVNDANYCRYDLQADFSDGTTAFWDNANVCLEDSWSIDTTENDF